MKYGLIPEFIGRLPVMATVEDLDIEALIKILTEPKNALTKQYARMFEMDDVELVFTPDSLDEISELALKRGTGARGLRAILEEVLLNTMYDLPSRDDIHQVLIDRDVVVNKVNPTLVPAREPIEPTEKSA
jgi:ATP-dependent Clp protease ATP-binding subunit ClpX